ncbi:MULTISPECIES: BatD family protein [unclassified Lacinutrix]|uniref:BatD family protein n=1 Tax=unclassified Lacinutrix TaxID=2647285 RepID=UPI00020A3517|nr:MULTISPECIES: BatD family protein [unclassified Lacinutrix]AEH00744.1 aerotolerance-related exported protein [Lacinutrix sp. 5H-3-7-4]OIQ17727.1 MAG: BatD protein [Lacinutrix sp. MedPE-SW]
MKLIKYISFLLIILSTSIVTAQVEFKARVSKKTLGLNERLRVDFSMNQDGDNFKAPKFSGFNIVGGPNQSVSNSWINGKRSFEKTYSYFLAPERMGDFMIEEATIEIEGKTYKSSPIVIKVTKAIDKPKDPNSPSVVASENIHLVAEVSKTNPYLNEAVTVVYKLYVSPSTGVSNWRETKDPEFDDFWSQNINPKGLKAERGKYKGEDYQFVILRRTVLYPQKTGKLEIEPLQLEVTAEVPTRRRDIFGQRLMSKVLVNVSAGSRTINVKPLPEENKPEDFNGAVGEFSINLSTSKTALNASESLQAKVEVEGKGNLKLFEIPKLNLPGSLEVYEPEHNENVRTTFNGMQGSISDSYTIVPQYKGKYPIPAISFSYFDPKTESYKRLSTNEQIVNVLEGPVYGASDNNLVTQGSEKQRVVLSNDQFAFIKTEPHFISKTQKPFFKSTAFWTSLLAPLLCIPLAIVFRRKRDERASDVVGNRLRKADRLAKKYLGAAKKSLGQKEAFYIALERALHNYLKAKLNIETSELSKDRISVLLTEKNVEQTVINDFISILENCELARYTPITTVTMQQDYDKAAKTINLIDKQIR